MKPKYHHNLNARIEPFIKTVPITDVFNCKSYCKYRKKKTRKIIPLFYIFQVAPSWVKVSSSSVRLQLVVIFTLFDYLIHLKRAQTRTSEVCINCRQLIAFIVPNQEAWPTKLIQCLSINKYAFITNGLTSFYSFPPIFQTSFWVQLL